MATITRITGLPLDPTPLTSDVLPIDGVGGTRKVTLDSIVSVGRPMATRPEAVAGTSNTLGMSPLRVAQAIAASESPYQFGAIGDGVTDDIVAWRAAEAAFDPLRLPGGLDFNIGVEVPANPVYGAGAVTFSAVTYDGFEPQTYAERSSTYLSPTGNPDPAWLYTEFPAASGHANTIVGAATPRLSDANFTRNTVLGAHVGQQAVSWNRNEGIGQGVMRWTKYGERNTYTGSLAAQYAGRDLTEDPDGHYFNHDLLYNAGVPVTDVAWDAFSLETKNPGIRAEIATWLSTVVWPSVATDFDRNVGFGRDTMVEFIMGEKNAAGAYRALGLLMEGDSNSAWGCEALFGLIFGNYNAAFGSQSGFNLNNGEQNLFAANGAGYSVIGGDGNVILGSNAGFSATYFEANYNVWIGYEAGRDTAANVDNTLRIQNARDSVRVPLITGQFDTGRVGINILPASIAGIFDIRDTSGNPALQVDTSRRSIINHTASVAQNGLSPQLQVHGTAASSSTASIARWSTGAGGPSLSISKSRGTSPGSFTIVSSGDVLGDILFGGADGAAIVNGARIRVLSTGAPASGVMPGRMQLAVSPAASATPSTIIDFTATTLGFFGATPVVKPTLPAAATDLATAIALANANRTLLINYGLAA